MGKGKAKPKPKPKPKSNKTTQAKKQVKPGDANKFSVQLTALGLRIVHVTADGNCFFRAIADQLEGNEEEHAKYRQMVVDYIMNHHEDYEPFVEDDVPFENYCSSMQEDGTWAGHMELQAASLVTKTNICIHRPKSPRWHILNFDGAGTRTLHLSYHDEEHYNSVRLKEDDGVGPAKPIVIEDDHHLASSSVTEKSEKSNTSSGNRVYDQEAVKLVLAGTGCTDFNRVHDVLQQMHGDIDVSIEFLIAEDAASIFSLQDAVQSCEEIDSNGVIEEQLSQSPPNIKDTSWRMPVDFKPSLSACEKNQDEGREETVSHQKIFRNKPCICGSKKKYKACCGAGKQNFSVKINSHGDLTKKARGMKLRNSNSESQPRSSCSVATYGTPDLGALYI